MNSLPNVSFDPAPEFPTTGNALSNNPGVPDPFDPARLRLEPDDDAALGVRELLTTVRYGTPSKESFFRIHPDASFRCTAGLVELKDDGESFWVDPSLWPHLAEEPTFTRRMVVTALTRQGSIFLWGLRLPGNDGKVPTWVSIPLEAAKAAESKWVKLYWDQSQRQHRIKVANGITDAPDWPELAFPELLRLAFRDRVISSLDHPILMRLRGEH